MKLKIELRDYSYKLVLATEITLTPEQTRFPRIIVLKTIPIIQVERRFFAHSKTTEDGSSKLIYEECGIMEISA